VHTQGVGRGSGPGRNPSICWNFDDCTRSGPAVVGHHLFVLEESILSELVVIKMRAEISQVGRSILNHLHRPVIFFQAFFCSLGHQQSKETKKIP